MPDLGHTAAEWKRQAGEELGGLFLAPIRELFEVEDKFRREREQVVVFDSRSTHISAVTLTGVRLSYNTIVDGGLILRISTNGGNKDLKLFKATGGGGGDEVARATNVAAGGAATFVEQNSSGISGTATLSASPANTSGDEIYLYPVIDYLLRAKRVLTGLEDRDTASLKFVTGVYEQVAALIAQARGILTAAATPYFCRGGVDGLSGVDFTERSFASIASEVQNQSDGSGRVTVSAEGYLPFLKLAMAGETTGGEQDVLERVMDASDGVMDPGNIGQFVVEDHVPSQHCQEMKIRAECIEGRDTGHGGRERFRLVGTLTRDGRRVDLGIAMVKQAFSAPGGVGPLTIERVYTKTGDDDDELVGPEADVSTSGEFSESNDVGNTENGKVYGLVEDDGDGDWNFSFWRSEADRASRNERKMVCQAMHIATGADFQANPTNASGLTIDWAAGSDPVDGTEFELDCNFAVVERTDKLPDQFEIDVTRSSEGMFQRYLGEAFGHSLNSDTSGSESIKDGYMTAGTFLPRSVLDR